MKKRQEVRAVKNDKKAQRKAKKMISDKVMGQL